MGPSLEISDETLRLLLSGGHLSFPEREALGIWPHPPLKFGDLVEFLVPIVKQQGYFPRVWEDHIEGEAVSEDMTIERLRSGGFVVRSRRHYPTVPTMLAAETEKRFKTPEQACEYYLKWNLLLPGDLDGWIVEE